MHVQSILAVCSFFAVVACDPAGGIIGYGPDDGPDSGVCPSECGDEPCTDGEERVTSPSADPSCTTCDGDACAASGSNGCSDHAPGGGGTNALIDADNCGGSGVACGPDQICNMGACESADLLGACPFDPMQWWRGPTNHNARDITFVAMGDTHAVDPSPGCSTHGALYRNEIARDAINSVPTQVWPGGASFYREGKPYDHVRGLIITGDLTEGGSESKPAGVQPCNEFKYYRDAYGRCGNEGRLTFPVYDVYGNHDFPRSAGAGEVTYHPVINRLDAITAADRPGTSNYKYDDPKGGTGHYAWRWDDIWFVNLNVKPGWMNEPLPGPAGTRIVDPHGSKRFLKKFLLTRTNSSRRQIVILSHYNMGSGRIDREEKRRICKVLYQAQHAKGAFTGQKLSRTHPVVAFIHGHNHAAPKHKNWTCPSPYNSITLPHFSAGTPNYSSQNNNGNVQFTIFRIGGNNVEAVGVRARTIDPTGSWTYAYKKRLEIMNRRPGRRRARGADARRD